MGGIGKISGPVVVPLEMVKFGNFQSWDFFPGKASGETNSKKGSIKLRTINSRHFWPSRRLGKNFGHRWGPFGNGQIWEFSKLEILFQEKPLELPIKKSFPINYGLSIPDIFSPWGELAKYRVPWWSLWKWSNLGIFKVGIFFQERPLGKPIVKKDP